MLTTFSGYIKGQGCFKGVLWVNQGCFKGGKGVSKYVQRGYKVILTICPVYFMIVSFLFQRRFKGVSIVF